MAAIHRILVLVVVASVSYNVEGGCPHLRTKRQASPILSRLAANGDLAARIPTPAASGVRGADGVAGARGRPGPNAKTSFRETTNKKSKIFNKYYPTIEPERLRELQDIIQLFITFDEQVIPNWVQLSFHECFGPFGCDGCLELENPANHGLAPTFELAMLIKSIIAPDDMTKADFLALLGTEAAKAAAKNAGGSLNLPYSVGRVDCESSRKDVGLPTGDILNTVSLLKSQFRLSDKEAVALMGAHSLGRARPENTGFSGPWDRSETRLDSGYYFVLNSNGLKSERVDNAVITSTQWKLGEFLMLPADLILRKQFTTSGEFDEPSCGKDDVTECPDQPVTAPFTVEFQNMTLFHQTFSVAFLKMINKSYSPLTRVE